MTTRTKNIILFPLNLLHRVSPKLTLKILFRLKTHHKLNLKNPSSFNEKLQWVKLNYKNPLLPKLVDKYTVRDYISQKAPELLTKLYWQGFDANDIPWDELPNKFVLKVTHGSSYNIICKDKSALDKKECTKKLNKWLKGKFLRCYGEWFYGVEKPRIIIEEFLDTKTGKVPDDYKVYCFNGKPEYVLLCTGRFEDTKSTMYDTDWIYQNVKLGYKSNSETPKPENLDELLKYAKLLSEDFPHVRVDLYNINGKIYFGELTFTDGAGFDRIEPYDFDLKLGNLFELKEF